MHRAQVSIVTRPLPDQYLPPSGTQQVAPAGPFTVPLRSGSSDQILQTDNVFVNMTIPENLVNLRRWRETLAARPSALA